MKIGEERDHMKFSWRRKKEKLLYHTVASFLLYIYLSVTILLLCCLFICDIMRCNLLTKLSAKTEKVSTSLWKYPIYVGSPRFISPKLIITEGRWNMVDLIMSHWFDFGLLGLGYFAIHRILSKKARELQFSFSLQNGIKFSCKFYKE